MTETSDSLWYGSYSLMVERAVHGYARGLSPREVLHDCYGVTFPDEVFVIVDADPFDLDWSVSLTNLPWQLAIPPEQGGPDPQPDSMEFLERGLVMAAPDLIPLAELDGGSGWHWRAVLCYRRSDLAAGRSTVYGFSGDRGVAGGVVGQGGSLLDVICDHQEQLWLAADQQFSGSANRGAGSVGPEYVDELRAIFNHVDDLRRRAT